MPVPALTRYSRAFFVTAKHLPEPLKAQLRKTVASIANDWPYLPGPHDLATRLPPSDVVWLRRRVASSSSWWAHYSVTADGIMVRSVSDLG